MYGGGRQWGVEGVYDAERNCIAPGGGAGCDGREREREEDGGRDDVDDTEITSSIFDASFGEIAAEQHRLRIAVTSASGAISWIGTGFDEGQESRSPRAKRADAGRSSFLLAGKFYLAGAPCEGPPATLALQVPV